MKVFIGGSRAISKLNPVIRDRLDGLVKRGCSFLVGDASGADRAVQVYFAERDYRDVIVYHVGNCRNNIGNWLAREIDPPAKVGKGFAYYAAKDYAMSRDADCGVMLWDARSRGTFQNLVNMVGGGKRTLLYLAPTQEVKTIVSEEDLQKLRNALGKYGETHRTSRKALPADQPGLPLL